MNYPEETNGHPSEEKLSLSRAATLNGFEDAEQARVEIDKANQHSTGTDQNSLKTASEDPKENPTTRLQWGKPLNKLALVLGGGAVVLAIIYVFIDLVSKPDPKPAPTAELQDFPSPSVEPAENQEGRMRAEVALGDQAQAQEKLAEKNAAQSNNNNSQAKATKPQYNTVRPPATTRTTAPRRVDLPPQPRPAYRPTYTSSPAPRRYSPPARPSYAPTSRSVPAPERVRSSARSPRPDPSVQQDPVEAWLVASSLGSYGGFLPAESTSDADGTEQSASVTDTIDRDSTPLSPVPSGEEIGPSSAQPNAQAPAPGITRNSPLTASTPLPLAQVNPQEEAAILNEQPQTFLIAGTRAAGILTTPMVWDEGGPQKQLLIRLSEPLMNSDNQVAFIAGTHVLTHAQSLSEAGVVRMVAVAALIDQGGQQVEVPLPQNALVIQAKDGGALRARKMDNKGPEIARMDLMSFALGAVAKASELFTRPQESVSIFNAAGGSIAQTNPEPNILAGVLQGGSEQLAEQLEERNDRALDAIASRPNLSFLPAGTQVEVYVNQTAILSHSINPTVVGQPLPEVSFGVAVEPLPELELMP